VLTLLQHAVSINANKESISSLCWMHGAQELQPDKAVCLLLQALQCDNTVAARTLIVKLLAASNLAAAANAGQLLQLAADKGLLPRGVESGQWVHLLKRQLRRL
jgi:hypothetical protein